MKGYKSKKIEIKPIIIAICIIASLLSTTTLTTGSDCRHAVNECKKIFPNELPLNNSFITDIIQKLSNITFKNESWLGREYGTPGERYAAKMLEEAWNGNISNDCIGDAVLDLIDKGIPFDGIDDKFGVRSKEDYKLVISGEEIPDTECFPILPIPNSLGIPSNQHFNFDNAEVHIAPDKIYETVNGNIQENNINLTEEETLMAYNEPIANMNMQEGAINISGDRSSIGNNKHIYLIEMKKTKESSVRKVAEKLYTYTKSNPKYPLANAFLWADYREDAHIEGSSASLLGGKKLPGILRGSTLHIPGFLINGSLGNKINQSITNGDIVTADFVLNAYVDRDVESYNVVGTIPGKIEDKTVVIGAHYDSTWGQCTIDNAVGVGIMFGIAKYFSDNYDNIRPNYTMKFVAFSGEECGSHGAKFYIWKNHVCGKEKIQYYINLDALGYVNSSEYPKENLSLNFWFHPHYDELKNLLQEIADHSNYQSRSGGYNITVQATDDSGIYICDGYNFRDVVKKALICFDKGNKSLATHWYPLDGENHSKGDTIDMVDWTDVYATAEVILNTTRHLALSEDDISNENVTSDISVSVTYEYGENKNIETIESRKEDLSYDVNLDDDCNTNTNEQT